MAALKPISIIGGGLAGLTLGIGLRRRGIPVTVREASHYPRHRVCGEFISGRGQDVLVRLSLHETFVRANPDARPLEDSCGHRLGLVERPTRNLCVVVEGNCDLRA